jgi:hypothetical protein
LIPSVTAGSFRFRRIAAGLDLGALMIAAGEVLGIEAADE